VVRTRSRYPPFSTPAEAVADEAALAAAPQGWRFDAANRWRWIVP
jgi:hypothetical protein